MVLPDGKIALQRRTKDAKFSPGLLGFFGGHLDPSETHEQAALRELHEETSLDVARLPKKYVADIRRVKDGDDALFHIYEAHIDNADFAVFEGDGVEVYSVADALARDDLGETTRQVLTTVWKGNN